MLCCRINLLLFATLFLWLQYGQFVESEKKANKRQFINSHGGGNLYGKRKDSTKGKRVKKRFNSTSELFRGLIDGDTYNKQDPPTKDKPTRVKLGIYVNSFYSISEQTMDSSINFYFRQEWYDPRLVYKKESAPRHTSVPFRVGDSDVERLWLPDTFFRNEKFGSFHTVTDYQLSMYLRQEWQDPRLAFSEIMPKADPEKKIRMGMGTWEEIWTPDVFFRNEKKASFHSISVPNRLLQIKPDGTLWYVSKISATLSCPMLLHNYPLDKQSCPIMFESFGYTMDTMYFAWLPKAIEIDEDVELPQFTLEDQIKYDCSQNYTTGAYPCLEIRFILRRDIGYFLIQVYIPSMLIVILSWVAFWINIDAIPARVSLGLLTVLTMTTQSTGARSSLPRVSYIKAIDVWMSVCLVFVFVSLLEFAVVNVISRKEVRTIKPVRKPPPLRKDLDPETQWDQIPSRYLKRNRKWRICFQDDHGMENIELDGRHEFSGIPINIVENGSDRREPPKVVDPEGKHKARKVDKISRKLFPIAFLLFNIIYWIFYAVPLSHPSKN